MRKSEMSPEQLAERATLLRLLTDAGWEPHRSTDATNFEADRWLDREVELGHGQHTVSYEADERRIRIRLEPGPQASRIGLLELDIQGPVGPTAELVIAHQARLSTEPMKFVTELVGPPRSQVRIFKGDRWHILTPETIRTLLEPTFVAIEYADLNFYLGMVIESSFFLASSDLAAAHARCLAGLSARTDDEDLAGDLDEMNASTTLEELFAASFVEVTTDADGNIVGLEQGGDMWVLDHLNEIADLVRPGSYFLIQDDRSRFWRVEYTVAGPRYHRESPG